MVVVLASNNKGKLKEIKTLLNQFKIQVLSPADIGINIDVKEDGLTYEENAIKKASAIMSISNKNTIADDSGLEIDFLNGEPGIYSARYGGKDISDTDRNIMILNQLKDIPFEKRSARFICAIAVLFTDGDKIVVRGECEGFIAFKPEGNNGFGYDPIFYLPEYNLTMGQLDGSIKNKISHRAKALSLLEESLKIKE